VRGHETILVVEDEDMVRKLTCSILKRAGYTVLSVAGSLEAIGVLKNHQGKIDLVLTDVIMPGMTGDELAVKVGDIRPDSAILFMSGHSGSVLEGVSKMNGDLLEKPFTADELAKSVRSALDQDRPGVAA
jgi:DNA-binding NtrC family response regulator